jgi:RNA polymerase sigma-70 factor, ECF subfamily
MRARGRRIEPDGALARGLDDRVRALLSPGNSAPAVTLALRALGPEVLGFLSAALGDDADADEVFAAVSERLWRSLATFEWRCSLRTWAYVIARRELERFQRGARRRGRGRVRISELEEVIEAVRTETRSERRSEERRAIGRLRDELPVEDRALLVLRVDRELPWDEIALAFVEDPDHCSDEERKRESARLRKRFQLVKKRLADRARAEGLLPA